MSFAYIHLFLTTGFLVLFYSMQSILIYRSYEYIIITQNYSSLATSYKIIINLPVSAHDIYQFSAFFFVSSSNELLGKLVLNSIEIEYDR